MKRLPIGIQSFVVVREEKYAYVDKTGYIKKLVEDGKYFFLSRPRRFGKSLFLDTLRQAFLGKKELFKGLYLENNWDWSKKYPVIYISFGAGVHKTEEELRETQDMILRKHAEGYDIKLEEKSIKNRFIELIEKVYKKEKEKVVILVDEYDKPILDNIEEKEIAKEMRESLKNFYSVIKDADEYIKFVFITGVTKFSKASIFSGLNNLNDITLDPRYVSICGITQKELEEGFKELLEGVDKEEMKKWYNGYNFLGEKVYNPFDVLLFLDKKIYRPYWFETGTPTFLIKLLMKERYYLPEIENLQVGEEILESFEIENIQPEVLLFQTGYLTIKSVEREIGMNIYTLTYPNLEVKSAINRHILNYCTDLRSKDRNMIGLIKAIKKAEIGKMKEIFHAFFASIPSDWYRKNDIEKYEGFYASVFYAYFAALGIEVKAEDVTNKERIDLTVRFEEKCYIFEFKVIEGKEKKGALEQLKEKRYHEKYKGKCKEIYIIGVEFDKRERNIAYFEWERV
ncbi:ATP-binding protein [Thermosipho sp. 1070]|uniref:ATP-binding protein n=1 Tax=Thermosipho sp. 1070 TaxID=1437364 RepID=UPI0009494658|nr:ATP-binding protein [Thermosipho sp. 1070]ANQ53662.1 hypothetical protein Y592_04340 [Thermosipho sp. 1070]